jgi:osmotically inducible protein OsmC
MAFTRKATAHWSGTLKEGKGSLSTEAGALKNTPYAFHNRFENVPGTNPEELIAAAHAGCFSMAFSADLGKAGFTPESIETTAAVTLDFIGEVPTVTKSVLTMKAKIPGISQEDFEKISQGAKAGCPISRLLLADITLEATLL